MDETDVAVPEVTVLRGSCGDDETCPVQTTVSTRPGRIYYVATIETDPDIVAAYAGRVGPGEILVWQPDDLPEVTR